MKSFSIILPAFNEEKRLKRTVEELITYFKEDDIELIIVEDGCTDNTPGISKDLAEEFKEVRHIHSEERLGKGKAVKKGLNSAANENICFSDIDAAKPELVEKILTPLLSNNADISIGKRSHENRNLKRKMMSKTYNFLARKILNTGVKDHQTGLKAIKADKFKSIKDSLDSEGWFWDTELLYRAKNKDTSIKEVNVKWPSQEESKVSPVPVAVELLQGLVKLKTENILGEYSSTLPQYLTFASIGALGAIINTSVLYVLTSFIGVYYLLSAIIGTETAIISMFFLNNRFTFDPKKEGFKEILYGILRSNTVRIGGIIVQISLLYLLTDLAGVYYILSNIIGIFVASIVNFIAEKHWNWS